MIRFDWTLFCIEQSCLKLNFVVFSAIVGDKSLFPAGTKKENKPVYKHKWAFDDEEDEEVVTGKDESQRNKVIFAAFCVLIVA